MVEPELQKKDNEDAPETGGVSEHTLGFVDAGAQL